MCWRSSPDRERPMVRLKRSTAGLNICAGLLWGSVTSPTTSPGVCSSPVASDRFYTLNYDEPHMTCVRSHLSSTRHRSSYLNITGDVQRCEAIPRPIKYTYSDKFRRSREAPELESDEVQRNCLDTKSKEP